MNDEQFVEAARLFAERILTEGGDSFEDRLDFAFKMAASQSPDHLRLTVLKRFFDRQKAIYDADTSKAESLLEVGDYPRNEALNVSDLAAWTMTASAILNLDEVLTH